MIVKGTSIGNVTGISGEYTISAEPEQTLSFAFLGYDTKEVKVGSRTTIDVTLTEQNKQISEVASWVTHRCARTISRVRSPA